VTAPPASPLTRRPPSRRPTAARNTTSRQRPARRPSPPHRTRRAADPACGGRRGRRRPALYRHLKPRVNPPRDKPSLRLEETDRKRPALTSELRLPLPRAYVKADPSHQRPNRTGPGPADMRAPPNDRSGTIPVAASAAGQSYLRRKCARGCSEGRLRSAARLVPQLGRGGLRRAPLHPGLTSYRRVTYSSHRLWQVWSVPPAPHSCLAATGAPARGDWRCCPSAW
jgi:hypothetical protein